MLTQRLAEHYGVEGVAGVEVRKVPVPAGGVRGGLLGHASVHKVTANGTTTTPVKRGVWVADRLLNEPPPPPPPGAGAIDPDTRGAATVREQLARHRANAGCAACHAKIDPPGFALEAFDPIGGLRTRYRTTGPGDRPPGKDKSRWRVDYALGPRVDGGGETREGKAFAGPGGFGDLLAADPGRLARAFAAHLSRYATGTDVSFPDRAAVHGLVERARGKGYGLIAFAAAESVGYTVPSHSKPSAKTVMRSGLTLYIRVRVEPAGGRRSSVSIRGTIPVATGAADFGAVVRRSASRASSSARFRARSDRVPSARLWMRQAMRLMSQTRLPALVASPNTSA